MSATQHKLVHTYSWLSSNNGEEDIFALGHELTHSHTADKKGAQNHVAEHIHGWPWYAYVQISQDKEAALICGRGMINESLALCGTVKPRHFISQAGFVL